VDRLRVRKYGAGLFDHPIWSIGRTRIGEYAVAAPAHHQQRSKTNPCALPRRYFRQPSRVTERAGQLALNVEEDSFLLALQVDIETPPPDLPNPLRQQSHSTLLRTRARQIVEIRTVPEKYIRCTVA